MRVRAQAFREHKAGNSPDDYEDSVHPLRIDRQFRRFRAAVADGATESSFAGLWADLLVREYCRGRIGDQLDRCELTGPQIAWRAYVMAKPLPWYAEEKVRSGAFSSLLGLTLSATASSGQFAATAVGDSCLFHWRGGRLIRAFPVCCAEEFGNHPYLISSNPSNNQCLAAQVRRARGDVLRGDVFLLMTDALACWCLSNWEAGAGQELVDEMIQNPAEFMTSVASLRADQRLRNDDVTLLRVEVD